MLADPTFLSGQPSTGPTLRPYQADALAAAEAYLAAGGRAGLLVLPPGAGKSILLASLAQRTIERGGRALVLAHVAELVGQNAAACARVAGEDAVGVFAASAGRREVDRSITMASIQTVAKRAGDLGPIDLAIVDEAHLINPKDGSGMYRRLMRDLAALGGRVPLVGLTSTPWRLTSGRLDKPWRENPPLFDRIVHEVGIRDLIRNGWLARPIARATRARLETAGVETRQGEFVPGQLQAAVDVEAINRAIVGEIVEAGRDRRSWLVFATGVKHAQCLASLLREEGVAAAAIDGATPRAQREAAIAAFRSGELRCLIGSEIFSPASRQA